MNILHVIPGDLWAGAEAQVYYTIKELSKCPQIKIVIIVFNNGELFKRLLNIKDIKVKLLDEKCLGNTNISFGIKKILIDFDIHIAHVHEYKSHILTAIAKLLSRKNNCILFRTQHGQNVPSRFKSHIVLRLEKFFLRFLSDHIIAVSKQLKYQLSTKFPHADIHLIYNAVDISTPLSQANMSKVRRSFGLTENQFWIGTAARLESVKNIHMLVEAAKVLIDNYEDLDFRISIFGDGSLREILRSQIIQYGLNERVFLEGHHNNMITVFHSLDVFTLTSLHEGLPMSLLEAMSAGTIPVCTAVGGMKEIISHGENGYLVPPDYPEELAKILAYISNEGSNLNSVRIKARERINQAFSIQQNCQNLLSLYEESLQQIVII